MVQIKIHPVLFIILLAGIFILLLTIIRGCNNSSRLVTQNKTLSAQTETLFKRIKQYKIDSAEAENGYNTALELLNGQIDLKENQVAAKDDSLDAANKRINKLLSQHIPVYISDQHDSAKVSGSYIQDWEGCFVELKNGRDLVYRYKKTNDSLRFFFKLSTIRDSSRIQQLKKENSNLSATINDAFDIAKHYEKNKPHAKILFSVSTMAINANVPNAAGFGFGFQDKYNRIFAAKYFTSEYGSIKQLDIFVPLSFKRR